MLRFILIQWMRHKERFILSLLGICFISGALIYLFGLTETTKGTVTQNLQKKWKSSYDLVVTPPNTIYSKDTLMEPNFSNEIQGGISYEEYEEIKGITDVEVAAPISVLGYTTFGIHISNQFDVNKESHLYRVNVKEIVDTGLNNITIQDGSYYGASKWVGPNLGLGFGAKYEGDLTIKQYQLVVGIDPIEEAKLVGLDKAIVNDEGNRYFTEKDITIPDKRRFKIPVIVNNNSFSNSRFKVTLEKLEAPFTTKEEQNKTIQKIRNGGGFTYLETLKGEEVESYEITGDKLEEIVLQKLKDPTSLPAIALGGTQLAFKPTSVNYDTTESPYPQRWSTAFQVNSFKLKVHELYEPFLPSNGYRNYEFIVNEVNEVGIPLLPVLEMNIIGSYSTDKLAIGNDPITNLPMETYRPATATIVLDGNNEPINPPREMMGSGVPSGLLTNPPNLLTTIQAAEMITGGDSISVIRVKVKGIEDFGEMAQNKLEKIKTEIEDKTGLQVLITRGSSPQPTITEVKDDSKTLAWIEQPWINLGSAITIFRETSLGYSSVVLALLVVGIIYVFATNLVSFYTRKKEYSIFLSLGWKKSSLKQIMLMESLLQVCIIGVIAIIVESSLYITSGTFNIRKLLIIMVATLLIYLVGTLIPMLNIDKINPYQTLKTGEVTSMGKHLFKGFHFIGFVFNQLTKRPGRNLLSVLAIALPATLLSFYLFVTTHLEGILYTSWLGEFVALEINSSHYIMMAISLFIGMLTTTEIMWQNISERGSEIALLKALGWKSSSVRLIILLEGAFIGLISGVIGVGLSLGYIGLMYGIFPWDSIFILLSTIIIPIIVGMVGAIIPSRKAMKIDTFSLLKESM